MLSTHPGHVHFPAELVIFNFLDGQGPREVVNQLNMKIKQRLSQGKQNLRAAWNSFFKALCTSKDFAAYVDEIYCPNHVPNFVIYCKISNSVLLLVLTTARLQFKILTLHL